jgi:uncharacterized protein (DUF1330 family)
MSASLLAPLAEYVTNGNRAFEHLLFQPTEGKFMQITINDKQKNLGKAAKQKSTEKVSAAFSKFGANIISIQMTVQDINGPRGGIDKECRIVVKLRKMEEVVAVVKEETFSKAISRAINRSERSIGRKIKRRLLREPSDRSGFKFAYHN